MDLPSPIPWLDAQRQFLTAPLRPRPPPAGRVPSILTLLLAIPRRRATCSWVWTSPRTTLTRSWPRSNTGFRELAGPNEITRICDGCHGSHSVPAVTMDVIPTSSLEGQKGAPACWPVRNGELKGFNRRDYV